jgi:hypothetical protein
MSALLAPCTRKQLRSNNIALMQDSCESANRGVVTLS